ncbi:hypothetical protein [Streptomyces sp. bgisy022]|uniref:hypothetical protein n=1 Tax=Streptomyces sp. bgisy022 TaxID=3413769 RepID=UPI003D73D5C3
MDPSQESARGLVRLEGHLLWAAELEDARRRAAAFAEQLPWLTTAQREDVERVYAAERVEASRAYLLRIRDRVAGLRVEYEERYRRLRTRCVAAALVAAASGVGTAAVALATRN